MDANASLVEAQRWSWGLRDAAGEAVATSWLRRNAQNLPARRALVFGERNWTYAELNEEVNRFAHWFIGAGVRHCDRVAFLSGNSPEFLFALLAAMKIGAIPAPINPTLPTHAVGRLIDSVGATLLCTASTSDAVSNDVAAERPQLRRLSLGPGSQAAPGIEEMVGQSPGEPDVEVRPEDIALIGFTGGTTGPQKPAVLPHFALSVHLGHFVAGTGMHPDERVLIMGPLFHAGALLGYVLPPASIGALMVLLPTFEPRSALRAIAQERLNHFWAVPTMLKAMWTLPDFDAYDVSSVEKVNLAGTTITMDVLKEVERQFPAAAVLHVYGNTECGIAITILNGRDSARKVGSVGQPFPGVSVRVVDEEGNDVERGSVGEIVVRSESCAAGYWGNVEATSAGRFPDGWARTGDLGRFDGQRYLYFVDRKKDIIVTGGENVASADVEQVVASHPAVRQVAVVGATDETWGEAVTACVVLEPGQALTVDELRAFCRSTLAGFQLPRRLEIMEELPSTAIGKIFKPSLRELLR